MKNYRNKNKINLILEHCFNALLFLKFTGQQENRFINKKKNYFTNNDLI